MDDWQKWWISESLGWDGMVFQHFSKKVANWAASESGSGMLKAVASTAMGILLATFIRTQTWPLTIFLAKSIRKMSSALAGLVVKLVPKWIFQRTVPVDAAAPTGAENEVELEVHEEGTAPSQAQVEGI